MAAGPQTRTAASPDGAPESPSAKSPDWPDSGRALLANCHGGGAGCVARLGFFGDDASVVGRLDGLLEQVVVLRFVLGCLLQHGGRDIDRDAGDQRQRDRVAGTRVDLGAVRQDRLRVEGRARQLGDTDLA
jgi:hypothetical protein